MTPVVSIVPTDASVTPNAPLNGAPGTSSPFRQTQKTELDRVVPLAKLGVLRVEIREVIRELPAIDGALQQLMYCKKKTNSSQEIIQLVGGSMRGFSAGGAPTWGNRAGGRAVVRTIAFQRHAL